MSEEEEEEEEREEEREEEEEEEEEKLGEDWGQGIRKGGKGQNTSFGILKEPNSETFQCALLRDGARRDRSGLFFRKQSENQKQHSNIAY